MIDGEIPVVNTDALIEEGSGVTAFRRAIVFGIDVPDVDHIPDHVDLALRSGTLCPSEGNVLVLKWLVLGAE